LLLVLLLMVLNLSTLTSIFLFGGAPLYFYGSIFTMLIIFLSFKYRMRKNWLSRAGDYSYSVYLLHVPIGVFLIGQLKTPYIQRHIAANILFDIFCYLVTLFLSFLAFKWVELPSIALGKSVAKMFGDNKQIAATL
jgi:peptidoglycan/LPS O-acetylase OafA/YrhL